MMEKDVVFGVEIMEMLVFMVWFIFLKLFKVN